MKVFFPVLLFASLCFGQTKHCQLAYDNLHIIDFDYPSAWRLETIIGPGEIRKDFHITDDSTFRHLTITLKNSVCNEQSLAPFIRDSSFHLIDSGIVLIDKCTTIFKLYSDRFVNSSGAN